MNTDTLPQILLMVLFLSNYFGQVGPERMKNPSDSMALVRGGTIQVGIDATEVPRLEKIFGVGARLLQDEQPKHPVTLDDFYIDRYPVTNEQFKKFTDANSEWRPGRIPPQFDNGNYLRHWTTSSSEFGARAHHPVVNVNWYAAVAYCRWIGKRLPSEAEWEYASRGGLNALFPWGDEPPDKTRANFAGAHLGGTSPIGTYPANGYGLFDMAGNVWEFLLDEWRPYPSSPEKNPAAGENRFADATAFLQVKTRRVIRGGSFDGAPVNLWVDYRDSHPPNDSREFVGFRCAKSAADE